MGTNLILVHLVLDKKFWPTHHPRPHTRPHFSLFLLSHLASLGRLTQTVAGHLRSLGTRAAAWIPSFGDVPSRPDFNGCCFKKKEKKRP